MIKANVFGTALKEDRPTLGEQNRQKRDRIVLPEREFQGKESVYEARSSFDWKTH